MVPKKSLPKAYSRPISFVYQPVINLNQKTIFGYEALMRGAGAKGKSPEEIFRAAYKEGCIVELDTRALATTFETVSKLYEDTLLFVNIEPITLGECFGKCKKANALFKKIKPHARQVVFEITERIRPWDFSSVQKGISYLKKSGAKFALDDVGGMSSELFRLMTLKPDFIKIDKGLISGAAKNHLQYEELVRLVAYSKKKKVRMIAEGIETKKDLALVNKAGISLAQGFYFARPNKKMFANLSSYSNRKIL